MGEPSSRGVHLDFISSIINSLISFFIYVILLFPNRPLLLPFLDLFVLIMRKEQGNASFLESSQARQEPPFVPS